MALVLALAGAAPAGAVIFTEYPIEPGSAVGTHSPLSIVSGPGPALWFADGGSAYGIGRVDPTGAVLPHVATLASPYDVASRNGTVIWSDGSNFGSRAPNGVVADRHLDPGPVWGVGFDAAGGQYYTSEFSADVFHEWVCIEGGCHSPGGETNPGVISSIALGPDSKLWMTAYDEDRVLRGVPDPATVAPPSFDLSVDLPAGSGPRRIMVGPDGNLWVADYLASAVDRITPDGARTRFPLPPGRGPVGLAAGPDGALWIAELDASLIGRMTVDGQLTGEFAPPTAGSKPAGIATGPDGAVWFSESGTGKIGRVVPDPPSVTPPPDGGGPAADTTAPVFTRRLTIVPRRFRVAARDTALSAKKTPRGAAFLLSLSEPAQVTVTVARLAAGRRSGKTCKRPTRALAHHKACVRVVLAGALHRSLASGAARIAFSGRLGSHAVARGRYRAVASAVDGAQNVSSPSSTTFSVVR
jgi:streptogramin lyase